ncbi:hypothetical protein [Streptomyces sp. NPDC056105]|uniref:hypothetical protein n=1 Tax=Streptomyces sp. NPDC056105 TaxID=3345714 RepID=UPI0035DC64EB
MSVITRARSLGRHRGKTPGQLRTELDEATCQLIGRATEIEELKGARNQLASELDETRTGAQRAAEDDARQIRDLRRQVADLKRKVDIGVKAEHVIAKTQPIPVLPLGQAPFAAIDPADVSAIVT